MRLLIFSTFLLSILLPSSHANLDYDYMQCLSDNSQPINPIFEAIYSPQNSSFIDVLTSYAKFSGLLTPKTLKPLAIIAALDESHVQATVICSKLYGLQIRIRSGGHDFEGLSSTSHIPFVILDMFNLRSIDIDIEDESAWVQSGAIIGELYYKIANKSNVHAFPSGDCHSIGVGGHFSGGGYGVLLRKYGLTTDNIVDAKIVDAKGIILDRKSMGENLFWAIRGGGGASFGVILSWKIKLVSVPTKLTSFLIKKTLEEGAGDIIYRWQFVAPKLPKDIFIRIFQEVANASEDGSKKTIVASFMGLYLGPMNELLPLMNQIFPELGLKSNHCQETSWIDSILLWSYGLPNGTPTEALLNRKAKQPDFYKMKSDFVKHPISKKGLEFIWQTLIGLEKVVMEWNPYGGRMDEIPDTTTPFPHRAGNLFKIAYIVSWMKDNHEVNNYHLNLSKSIYNAMTPYVSKSPRECFYNYRDLDIGANPTDKTNLTIAEEYGRKYFKENYYRLVYVKTQVDPDNFFRHEQSIPPLLRSAN